MVATLNVPDDQTALFSTCVELSLNVPVAVNCWVAPLVIEEIAGVNAIDCSVAGVTVSTVEPVMLPTVAVMPLVPVVSAVARPVTLMVATLNVPEDQTALFSTCVELSLNVPVAVNCWVAPLVIEGLAGVKIGRASCRERMGSTVEPVVRHTVAVMRLVPVAIVG